MDQLDKITHGLVIFGRMLERGSSARSVGVAHDVIYAGPDPSTVNERDLKRLDELGWHPDTEFDCFYHFV